MRTSDIFVISSAKDNGPGSFLLKSAMFSESIVSSENLISRNIENLRMEDVSCIEELLPYIDMKGEDTFTLKPSVVEDVFKDLYVSLLENMRSLSFEDFCSVDVKEMLKLSSPHTPIIAYWDDEDGFSLIGVLEDFLRMPDIKDSEYRLHAVLSRHC